MTRRVVLVVLLLVLALPVGAGAVVVPGKGMFGIEVGMTAEQVLAVHPDPSGDVTTRNRTTIYTYGSQGVRVYMDPDASNTHWVVNRIATKKGRERTAEGVGVGTAERNVRAKLAGEHCRTAHRIEPQRRDCYLGSHHVDAILTTFHEGLKSHIVRSVTVERVLDY